MHASCYSRDRLARDPSRPAQVEILIHPHLYSPAIFTLGSAITLDIYFRNLQCLSFYREKFVIYCNMNPEDPQLKTEVNVNWFLEHAFDKLMKKRKMEQFYCEIYPTMLWSK